MNETGFFLFKVAMSAVIISGASWLSGRKPFLAGFLIALPLMSILAIFFSYFQYRDMNKVNQFATSILISVPLSIFFFVPFLLNRWLHLNFYGTFFFAFALLFIAFLIHGYIFQIK